MLCLARADGVAAGDFAVQLVPSQAQVSALLFPVTAS
jgi:hypothetical protein